MSTQKHVHFIGIAGKGTAPVAAMMKKLGWKVTGSDTNVFEPMPTYLSENGIEFYDGFRPEMIAPADIVVIGGSMLMKDMNNPEFLEAKRLNKKLVGYEYLLQQFVVKKNSIVVAGTYGKTTTSALMAWIFINLKINPSYFTAGKPIDYESAIESTNSEYSVFEGDEYASVWGYDMEPRFIYYKPTHTMISATKWDHVNIYPTLESYINAFKKLVKLTFDNSGTVLLCASGENNDKLMEEKNGNFHTYYLEGENLLIKNPEYVGEITEVTEEAFFFTVKKNAKTIGQFSTKQLGRHNVENCVGAIAMCDILGFDLAEVGKAIATFSGTKVHLEILGKTKNGTVVVNDFAHSPVKAKASLDALRMRYPNKKIVAIFDPHSSSLSDRKSLAWYKNSFDKADEVIIPAVGVKQSTPKEDRVYGKDIVEAIQTSQPNARYLPLDEKIVDYIKTLGENEVVAFMSAGGWRGIIDSIGPFTK